MFFKKDSFAFFVHKQKKNFFEKYRILGALGLGLYLQISLITALINSRNIWYVLMTYCHIFVSFIIQCLFNLEQTKTECLLLYQFFNIPGNARD